MGEQRLETGSGSPPERVVRKRRRSASVNHLGQEPSPRSRVRVWLGREGERVWSGAGVIAGVPDEVSWGDGELG